MGYMNAVTEEDILSDCGCGDLDIFWKSSPLLIYICLRTDLFLRIPLSGKFGFQFFNLLKVVMATR